AELVDVDAAGEAGAAEGAGHGHQLDGAVAAAAGIAALDDEVDDLAGGGHRVERGDAEVAFGVGGGLADLGGAGAWGEPRLVDGDGRSGDGLAPAKGGAAHG